MRYLLLLLFFPLYGNHLIIHMDINRTIIASDATQNLGLTSVVNLSLAKKYVDIWEEGLVPMSYFDYIYLVKHPGVRSDQQLRRLRRNTIHDFIDHLEKINHPRYAEALTTLQKAESTMEGRFIFPSFYKLLGWLEENNISHSLVFRTFGTDLEKIAATLGWDIPKASFRDGKLHTENGVIDDPLAMLHFFQARRVLGIQDDYFYWNKHKELKEYGKQFPLLLSGSTKSIFFDDNIEFDPEVNIVAPYDAQTKEALKILPLIEREVLIPVITVDAILDEDYFIHYLEGILSKPFS
ncbi:MAG: hypothetical protein H7A36_03085 [Chlamydiales bacterium]|nr:hypothetical protein [Chlamydiales bacterium]